MRRPGDQKEIPGRTSRDRRAARSIFPHIFIELASRLCSLYLVMSSFASSRLMNVSMNGFVWSGAPA
jgi:hypothetical protein